MNFNINTEKYVIEKSYDFLGMNESKISELFKTEGELTIHDGMLKMKTTSNKNPRLHAAIIQKFKLTDKDILYFENRVVHITLGMFKKNEINDRITRNDSKMRGRYGKENIYSRKT